MQWGARGAREREQTVDQGLHAAAAGEHALEQMLAVGRERIVVVFTQRLCEAGDAAQRRAQIVRYRVAERLQLAVRGLKLDGAFLHASLELAQALFELHARRAAHCFAPLAARANALPVSLPLPHARRALSQTRRNQQALLHGSERGSGWAA